MEGERGLARIEGERVRNIGWWPPVCAVETTTTSTTTMTTTTTTSLSVCLSLSLVPNEIQRCFSILVSLAHVRIHAHGFSTSLSPSTASLYSTLFSRSTTRFHRARLSLFSFLGGERERKRSYVRTHGAATFLLVVWPIYTLLLSLSLSLLFCLALSRRLCANVLVREREREREGVLFSRSSKGDSPGFYPAAVAETFFSLSRG